MLNPLLFLLMFGVQNPVYDTTIGNPYNENLVYYSKERGVHEKKQLKAESGLFNFVHSLNENVYGRYGLGFRAFAKKRNINVHVTKVYRFNNISYFTFRVTNTWKKRFRLSEIGMTKQINGRFENVPFLYESCAYNTLNEFERFDFSIVVSDLNLQPGETLIFELAGNQKTILLKLSIDEKEYTKLVSESRDGSIDK